MDAEKLAMQRRIDALDQHATRLHAALTEYERENARLKVELETVKRERDAAVETLRLSNKCDGCKYASISIDDEPCVLCARYWQYKGDDKWEWRGLCDENGGEEDAQG